MKTTRRAVVDTSRSRDREPGKDGPSIGAETSGSHGMVGERYRQVLNLLALTVTERTPQEILERETAYAIGFLVLGTGERLPVDALQRFAMRLS